MRWARANLDMDLVVSELLTAEDQEQKNVEHAMIKMVENHLYWTIMHWRTSSVDNTVYKIHLPTFLGSKVPLGLLNLHFKFNIQKKIQKKVKTPGG